MDSFVWASGWFVRIFVPARVDGMDDTDGMESFPVHSFWRSLVAGKGRFRVIIKTTTGSILRFSTDAQP
jgi:hypothetical protein